MNLNYEFLRKGPSYEIMNRNARITIKLAVTISLLAVLFFLTSPTGMPSILLILPFILIFLVLYWAAKSIIKLFDDENELPSRSILRKSKLLGVLIGALPVWLLVLQSIGQLTWRDAITSVTLFILAYGYIIKTNKQS